MSLSGGRNKEIVETCWNHHLESIFESLPKHRCLRIQAVRQREPQLHEDLWRPNTDSFLVHRCSRIIGTTSIFNLHKASFHHRVCQSLKRTMLGGNHLGCFFWNNFGLPICWWKQYETMRFEEVELREFVDVSHEDLRCAMTHVGWEGKRFHMRSGKKQYLHSELEAAKHNHYDSHREGWICHVHMSYSGEISIWVHPRP